MNGYLVKYIYKLIYVFVLIIDFITHLYTCRKISQKTRIQYSTPLLTRACHDHLENKTVYIESIIYSLSRIYRINKNYIRDIGNNGINNNNLFIYTYYLWKMKSLSMLEKTNVEWHWSNKRNLYKYSLNLVSIPISSEISTLPKYARLCLAYMPHSSI